MADTKDFVKLACDAHRGIGEASKYSKTDMQAFLREQLLDLLGGSTKFDAKTMRRNGNAAKVYTLVEEVIQNELHDYWSNNEMVNRIVDYRNIALGDEQAFYIQDDELLSVATISEGNTNIRRQRLDGGRFCTIETEVQAIKIYEEMLRVLTGRVDFNHLIDVAVRSVAKNAYSRQMKAWNALNATTKDASGQLILGNTYFKTGSYTEDTLLDLIANVEADTNETAVIYGTKKALRTIGKALTQPSSAMRDEMNTMGYLGHFYGTECLELKQTHDEAGNMLLDDTTLYVVASSDKPIKYITEGSGMIDEKSPTDTADMTYEWFYYERNGVGIVVNKKFGKYKF